MANRFAVPGQFWTRGMLLVQIDAAHAMVVMSDQPDFLWRLNEEQLSRIEQKRGDTWRPASHFAVEHRSSGEHRFVDLFQCGDNPWLQNRVGEVRDAEGRLLARRQEDLIADVGMVFVGDDWTGSAGRRQEFHADSFPAYIVCGKIGHAACRRFSAKRRTGAKQGAYGAQRREVAHETLLGCYLERFPAAADGDGVVDTPPGGPPRRDHGRCPRSAATVSTLMPSTPNVSAVAPPRATSKRSSARSGPLQVRRIGTALT